MSRNNQAERTVYTEVDQLVARFDDAGAEERATLVEQLRQLLPRQFVADRGLHFEATLHAPQMAHRLDAIRDAKSDVATRLAGVDAYDEGTVRQIVTAFRDRERQEAALLAEIWYQEIGGDG